MIEQDLFAELAYPAVPGARRNKCSRDAAEAIKPRALSLRDQALAWLKTADLTADEVADLMKRTPACVRPRLSELVAENLIYDTGRTRRNASGLSASVWRAY